MGGSGSGGWRPTTPSSPCERVRFRAEVNSPQPEVISTLVVGHVLDVALWTAPAIAVVVLYQGAFAGALTGTQVNGLIECLQNGFTYSASVVSISGGKCTVEVFHL